MSTLARFIHLKAYVHTVQYPNGLSGPCNVAGVSAGGDKGDREEVEENIPANAGCVKLIVPAHSEDNTNNKYADGNNKQVREKNTDHCTGRSNARATPTEMTAAQFPTMPNK